LHRSRLRKINLDYLSAERPDSDRHVAGARGSGTSAFASRLDGILTAARARGLVSDAELERVAELCAGGSPVLSWREFTNRTESHVEGLYRLAAVHHGFRAVNVCQLATLAYNTKLTKFLSESDWTLMFELGIVPVVEFGIYPDVIRRHLLATWDPMSTELRPLVGGLPMPRTELVFVPRPAVHRLQNLLEEKVHTLNGKPISGMNENRPHHLHRIDTPSRRRAA